MKMIALLAAASVVTLAVPVAAEAAPGQVVTHTRTTVAYDQHHGKRAYWRKVCTAKWRGHHKVRTCRRVRGWR